MLRAAFVCAVLSCASLACALDWPMYGRDLRHSFTNADSAIDSTNAAFLVPAWNFTTADAVTASPAVTGGVVYVGAWDGFFYALDAATGAQKWRFQVDCDPMIFPIPAQCPGGPSPVSDRVDTDGGIITSSAAVVDGKVYFGAGKTMYCLNAGDGSLVWKTVICGNPEAPNCAADANDPNQVFGSPSIFEHHVIIGTSTDGRADGYRGGIVSLSARTGRQQWRFEVDPMLDGSGRIVHGPGGTVVAQNRGCGNVWASGAVDEKKKLVFFGTADCGGAAPPPYHEAILALRTGSGRIRWTYRPRQSDTCDFDFGASANIIDVGGNAWLGAGGKDGTYYVLDRLTRNPAGELVWSANVVFGGSAGGFIGSTAFDGQRVYGGTAFGDFPVPSCDPSNPRDTAVQPPFIHAFDPGARTVAWEQTGAVAFGATSVANGVVFAGSLAPTELNAFAAATGRLLGSYPMPGAVDSSAVMVGDTLFVGSGNSYNGQGGGVHALRLP